MNKISRADSAELHSVPTKLSEQRSQKATTIKRCSFFKELKTPSLIIATFLQIVFDFIV